MTQTKKDPAYLEYAPAIVAALMDLFANNDGEEPRAGDLFHFDLKTVDLTAFLTAIPHAVNLLTQRLTGQKQDTLEMTYMLNRLVVQALLKDEEEGEQHD